MLACTLGLLLIVWRAGELASPVRHTTKNFRPQMPLSCSYTMQSCFATVGCRLMVASLLSVHETKHGCDSNSLT